MQQQQCGVQQQEWDAHCMSARDNSSSSSSSCANKTQVTALQAMQLCCC
jgi:hypothetical protein